MRERIGGFRDDGSYVQRIIRRTERGGKWGFFPPQPGERIVTSRGPMEVKEVELIEPNEDGSPKRYFRAKVS